MKSPFPGMDPYLESHWGDVHSSLIIYARDQLQRKLPPGLRARVEERVFVEAEEETARSIYPDVHVIEEPLAPGGGTATAVLEDVAVAEPVVLVLDEPVTQTFVEIIDPKVGGRVVTTIEFLSPSNKFPGKGRDLYLQKQEELKRGGISSVEIDLLLDGLRTFSIPDDALPPSHRHGYAACIRRGWLRARYELYAFPLRQRLPGLRIPLRRTDADVILDLQALVDQCYENGGYDTIDYRANPEVPLTSDDTRWVENLLRDKARR